MYTSAIIVAAGNSTRMGLQISKTLITLNEKPAIFYTLQAFELADHIDEIVLVCRTIDKDEMESIARDFSKVKCIVPGGDTRTMSVYNGVKAASECTTHFAIHDGARALVTTKEIDNVVEAAFEYNAATLGTKVTDTIKVVDDDVLIEKTIDRTKLYAVQTPQVFEKSLYLAAIHNAIENDLQVTDDCSLLESIDVKVKIIEGFTDNIKLTTQNDIVRAQIILESRK